MPTSIYTRAALYKRSLGSCAIAGCPADLYLNTSVGPKFTAEAAHIFGENEGSARFNSNMTDAQRNSIDNVILMCPTHHSEIDADEETWTAEKLIELKSQHENTMYAILQTGKTWRQKFLTLDYINLPRLTGMRSGALLTIECERAGLKPDMTLRELGWGVGRVEGAARTLLAQWDARATPFSDIDLSVSANLDGQLVSFNTVAYTKNCPAVDKPTALTGNLAKDPHIWFKHLGKKVRVRYDPAWITTNTAYGNLSEGTARFAGIGVICRNSEEEVVMSAWALGKPMVPEVECFYGYSPNLTT